MIDLAPPHSIEAEQSVLGGLMMDNQKFLSVSELITTEDFYKADHKLIYEAIVKLDADQSPFDPVTLSESMEKSGTLDNAGGLTYLVQLANNTPSGINAMAYARIVKERSIFRQIIQAANKQIDAAYNPKDRKAAEILESAQDEIFSISLKTSDGQKQSDDIKQVILSALTQLERRFNTQGIEGLETGIAALDENLNGLQKGEFYLIGARPAMGKTTFALNLLRQACSNDARVVMFSLEMPKERLIDKLVSDISSVNFQSIKTGKLSNDEWARVSQGLNVIGDYDLVIDDRAGLTIQQIQTKLKRLHAKKPISLVVIDYLQLVRCKTSSRFEEISEISRRLKEIAKTLNCPVVALSQLNRSLENRTDKRPIMADLRESGQLEQDADAIMFLYRDEVYFPEQQTNKGVCELIVSKNRFGETGKILLISQLMFSRFKDFSSDPVNYIPYEKKTGAKHDL